MNRSVAEAELLLSTSVSSQNGKDEEFSALMRLAGQGTAWTLTAYGAAQVIRLGGNILLTHLLAPQYFGLMTLLNTMIIGLNLFSDLGIASSIIRSEKGDDHKLLNTAWSIQVLRGIGLWLFCVGVSGPVARFYGEPQLQTMFLIVGLCLVVSGFESTTLATMAKHMAVREIVLLELSVQLAQLVFTVIWALIQPSVWALIAGRIAAECLKLFLSYRQPVRYRNRFTWDKEAARSIFKFGRWIFLSTALTFVATQSDRLIIGKLVSLQTLGLYGIAFALADVPRQIILQFSGRIALPLVSKLAHVSRCEYRALILRYRRPVLGFAAVVLALVVVSGDWLLLHLYDHRYHDAAWIVPILALGLWHTVLYCTANPCLVAIGKPQYSALGYLVSALSILLLTPWGFKHWGLSGAVWTIAFSDLPMYLASTFGLWSEDLPLIGQDVQATLLFIVACVLFAGLRLSAGISVPHVVALH
jgi:O-antigen/teichoic acid export membrane protein